MATDTMRSLESWYQHLSSRKLDIVGDFGGKELFLVDGDSLLLHCLTTSALDFHGGFQLVHAVYAVESFLENLKSRGCNFHVIFFQQHRELCIPKGATDSTRYKYELTRAIVREHLQRYSDAHVGDGFAVFCFESMFDQYFTAYLAQNAVLFLVCHDGYNGSDTLSDVPEIFLSMIHESLRLEYSVALLHSLEFSSSRVFASIITSGPSIPLSHVTPQPTKYEPSQQAHLPKFDQARQVDSSYRARLTVATLSKMLQDSPDDDIDLAAMAMLVHTAILGTASLAGRAVDKADPIESGSPLDHASAFMSRFCREALTIMNANTDSAWLTESSWDLFDFIDGRLFLHIYQQITRNKPLPVDLVNEAMRLAAILKQVIGRPLTSSGCLSSAGGMQQPMQPVGGTSVLPFAHPVLDEFLASIKLEPTESDTDVGDSNIFQELTHWHNAKKPLDLKRFPQKPAPYMMKKAQWFSADMEKYSKSLTSASGKDIKPETIFVSDSQPVSDKASKHTNKSVSKAKGPGQKTRKQQILEESQAFKNRNAETKSNAAVTIWQGASHVLAKEENLVKRFTKALKYFHQLSEDNRSTIDGEASLYLCDILYRAWREYHKESGGGHNLDVVALLYDRTIQTTQMTGMTSQVVKILEMLSLSLRINIIRAINKPDKSRKLSFRPAIEQEPKVMQMPIEPVEFQLQFCGPYLERSFDAQEDTRVPFKPDAWQRSVLDGIDQDKSLFISAPTSSGKTFISFYAMKKVLQSDDDGVLVYVAPTKALVNQIAAEINARFQKRGRSVWAIHTRDYRINNPTGCQVLVTVPHILQIMLLAPTNASAANAWSHRVKRIIFDEVHCIGQAEDGVIWEQLLLMAPCPIIALSATVGNPLEFYNWLKASQSSKGFDLKMVQHHSRYSDLRAFSYAAPEKFSFGKLEDVSRFPTPGLDSGSGQGSRFAFVHPIAAIIHRTGVDVEDISLEPRDAWLLWDCMQRNQTKAFPLDSSLDPSQALSGVLAKADVLTWVTKLKATLADWMQDSASPFTAVRAGLLGAQGSRPAAVQIEGGGTGHSELSLLTDLRSRQALPAILFNYDRVDCEATLERVLGQLEDAELKWKQSSRQWAQRMEKFKSWKASKDAKPASKPSKMKKDEREREEAEVETSPWETFDPDAPQEGFSFADYSKCALLELKQDYLGYLKKLVKPHFIAALERGIGVHHAGMNRRYRQVVEMLFRKGFLTAVIATGTLALGINMPCKTVVFTNDSPFLTPLNFRQGAGRAGRRGFDPLGNVVFHNISSTRAFALMTSRLPDLKGHFPLSTSLLLRILGLLDATKNSKYAADMLRSLLFQNRLYLGGPEAGMAIQHHVRFSIEYLRRQCLLSATGKPLNFAGLIGHLYFTENAVFAFHSLLKGGYFHRLCSGIGQPTHQPAVLRELALVLAHLFGRKPAPRSITENPSLALPRLPEDAERLLLGHNAETLRIFQDYASTFVDHHLTGSADNVLPLTKTTVGGETSGTLRVPGATPATKLRSSFVALSGHTDDFASIKDLCSTIRSGVFLEESVVPYLPVWPHDMAHPLNAYLYNFYLHGDMSALVRDNGIKKGDVWFLLKDYSLVLATIVASLTNYISPDKEFDVTAVQDSVETPDDRPDEGPAEGPAEDAKTPVEETTTQSKTLPKRPKKKVVVESWDEEDDDDEPIVDGNSGSDAPAPGTPQPSWEERDASLLNVLKAFAMLKNEFDEKFYKTFA
ncbi:hypothetical protein F4780DRAFT_725926 [Xylariomycetidae sp. FL0641]|nr:hypothetical protein F4780DRAFT_725926 [Xylariomycetidae sp. FL0641]